MSQSVVRALSILSRIAAGATTLGELAAAEKVHKSTVLRHLRALEDSGFVHRHGPHEYTLGAGLFRLAQQALDAFEVRVVAAPRLRALRDETGQTVHLAGLDGDTVTYVDKHEPTHLPIRMSSRIGLQAPLHATAVGKVLLAGLEVPDRARIASRIDYTAFTPHTIADAEELLAQVEVVHARGWAVDHTEHEVMINCIAAPVRGPDGRVLAAVSISVPDALLAYDDVLALLPQLLAAAADVSAACGHQPTAHDTVPPDLQRKEPDR